MMNVREKQQLISSTLEDAARQTLQMRRPRLIAVREQMVDVASTITLPVALQSVSVNNELASFDWQQESNTSIHNEVEHSEGEFTEVTASIDSFIKDPPNPDDESVYTEVTLEDEVFKEPSVPSPTALVSVDGGPSQHDVLHSLQTSTLSSMDEALLRSPMALILEKRTRRLAKHTSPYFPGALIPRAADNSEKVQNQQLKSLENALSLKGGDALRTESMSSSSIEMTVESFLQRYQNPPMTPRRTPQYTLLASEHKLAALGPVPPSSPTGISPASTKTTKRENTRRSTFVTKSPSSRNPKAPGPARSLGRKPGGRQRSTLEGDPVSNVQVPVAKNNEVCLPAMVSNSQAFSPMAQSPPYPKWSKGDAVLAPLARGAPLPKVAAMSATPKPVAVVNVGHPTTIHVIRDTDTNRAVQSDSIGGHNTSSSTNSNSSRIYAIRDRSRALGKAHHHHDQNPHHDTRTVVSALTLDQKAYEVKVPLAFDTEAILEMLESTSSSSMWDDSDSDDSIRSYGNGVRRANDKPPTRRRRRRRRRGSTFQTDKKLGTVRPLRLLHRVRALSKDPGKAPLAPGANYQRTKLPESYHHQPRRDPNQVPPGDNLFEI
jgi:hypothetical protein